jgi:nicotinamide mononucleotide transporter PnuC
MCKVFNRKNLPIFLLIFVTAIGITVTSLIFKQSFLRILPLYISLLVLFLQSGVNRFAPLIGGINSVIYAVVYFYYGLYATALFSLLFSAPLQIITFIRWSHHRVGNTTELRKLSTKQRLTIISIFVLVWALVCYILIRVSSDYALLDTSVSLLGILTTFLMLFGYIEYTVLQVVSGVVTIALYINMIVNGVSEQVPYLVFAIYSLICICISVKTARKLFKHQENSKTQG